MRRKRTVIWQAEDGYAGGARPHHLTVGIDDFDEDQSLEDIKEQLRDMIQKEFDQVVYAYSQNLESVAEEIFADLAAQKAS